MPSIKTRKNVRESIKTVDKGLIVTRKIKKSTTNITELEEKTSNNDENVNSFANENMNKIVNEPIKKSYNVIKFVTGRNEKENLKRLKTKYVMTKQELKRTKKSMQKARQVAQESAKRTYINIKLTMKLIKATIKVIQLSIQIFGITMMIIFSGVLGIIVLICLIGLLFGSIFGIFFSSENLENMTMSSVIKEINTEVSHTVANIQNDTVYDEYRIESERADWKEVLAIYSVKLANMTDVLTLDDFKKNELKKIFWDMNNITFEIKDENTDINDENNDIKKVLYIKINSKSVDEMMNLYSFTIEQKKWVNELLDEKYSAMWSSVIIGNTSDSSDFVRIALLQVGNVGNEYWNWYGFSERVEWCAIFVSWVADQVGYIDAGIIPKFSSCESGIEWFKSKGRWNSSDYIPKTGDIIFLDWELDGEVNHVGIVEKVENGKIHTIEGNSTGGICNQKEYNIGSEVIFGYGVLNY